MARIALIQQFAGPDRNENLRIGLNRARQAADAGANIIAFAEVAFQQFFPQKRLEGDRFRFAEPIPGPTTDAFASWRRRRALLSC